MRLTGRILGWLLVFGAMCSFAYEVVLWYETERYTVIALGQMIYDIWPGFLPYLQAGVQRNLHPAIWDPGIQSLLLLPGWLVFGAPGVVLLILTRGKRRKSMFRS